MHAVTDAASDSKHRHDLSEEEKAELKKVAKAL